VGRAVHRDRAELTGRLIADAITSPGKVLSFDDTVGAARRLLAKRAVKVVPVLAGTTYVGAVDRGSLGPDVSDHASVVDVATVLLPTVSASTPAVDALAALDRIGGRRLVVIDDDGAAYVGLVCMRRDRERLCVDEDSLQPKGHHPMSTTIDPDTHVAALVVEQPGRARVFERFAINYCCGGKTPLRDACEERGLEVEVVLRALEESHDAGAEDTDWMAASLTDLCAHIVSVHHAYLLDELPRLRQLVDKVVRAHGDGHPELAGVEETFAALSYELVEHMAKEEQVLFPACVALEHGAGGPFPFGSVGNPIAAMLHEHDAVGAMLARLRELTNGYEVPLDSCNSYRAMLDRLETLELDTHRHIHEENNVLFPRALALESGGALAA